MVGVFENQPTSGKYFYWFGNKFVFVMMFSFSLHHPTLYCSWIRCAHKTAESFKETLCVKETFKETLSAFYLVFQTHLCDSLSRNSHASKHERARHSKVCIRHFLNMKRSILSLSDSLVFYVKKQKYKCLRRKTSPPRSSNITSVRPVRFSLICHFSTAIYTLIPTRYKNKTFLK